MSKTKSNLSTCLTVVTFAIAMAWVEAAVVFYLRTMVDRVVPYQPEPLPVVGNFVLAELVREVATLLMLATIGIVSGATWRTRLGYTLVAFGIWDIFYYVFLKVLTGWPRSLLDWDLLFLLPLPWWGPVLAPILISILMIMWGTITTQFEHLPRGHSQNWRAVIPAVTGIALALYVFMADTIRVAGEGLDAIRTVLPERFNWPLFMLAYALMAVPVFELIRRVCQAGRFTRAATHITENLECNRPPKS